MVVSVTANAHSGQLFITLYGYRRAGFRELRMLNEHRSARLEFSHRHRDVLNARTYKDTVNDLGGTEWTRVPADPREK